MHGYIRFHDGNRKTKILVIIGVCLGILALAAALVFIVSRVGDDGSANKQDPTSQKSKDATTTQRIITNVGKLYEVPTDEEPTVAAIQDKTRLDGQAFFDKAKNGDYLLVYAKAELALLYREDINKLVNVGPVNMQDKQNESSDAITNPE